MKGIINYIKKHATKKNIIIFSVIVGVLLLGYISWELIFSRYYIFHKYEKKFLEEVKSFYYYHPEYLPKEGYTHTKTLGELYEEDRIEELKIPKKNKTCDINSWVKVYNDNGTYKYNTYLVCGRIKSKTDNVGPEITLNGDSTIYVGLNEEYKELGVKSVKDNKDGKMDIEKVTIDSSKVDTKKLGEYVVTYKIRDKIGNITTVERKVIVARNLTTIVKNDTKNTDGYYKGIVNNNYVLFSGMLFRIIKVNEDGTLLLLSADNIVNLRFEEEKYKNSNIEKYLNDVFLDAIYDKDYLMKSEYCIGQIDSFEDYSKSCEETIKTEVSLLSIDDFEKTFANDKSFLCDQSKFALSNTNGKSVTVSKEGTNCVDNIDENVLPAIRPVITIKANAPLSSGLGTLQNPYKLEDYSYGKVGEKISTRIIGEYISYSNTNFRIIAKNDDTLLLMGADSLKQVLADDRNGKTLTVTIPTDKEYEFNLEDVNNPGYIINNNYIDYINDNNIVTNTYTIPTNVSGKKYNEYSTKEIEAKISLPKTYDLFSSIQTNDTGYLYLYLDKLDNNMSYYQNRMTGEVLEGEINKFGAYGVKPVITIKNDLVIKGGKGTAFDPYRISK